MSFWDKVQLVVLLVFLVSNLGIEYPLCLSGSFDQYMEGRTGPFWDLVRAYGKEMDPLFGNFEYAMQLDTCIHVYFNGPLYVLNMVGILAGAKWREPLALFTAGALLRAWVPTIYEEHYGATPANSHLAFYVFNGLWMVWPVVVLARAVFSAGKGEEKHEKNE